MNSALPSRPIVLALVTTLVGATSARADLTVSVQAGATLQTDYTPPDPLDDLPGRLTVRTQSVAPASLHYLGQSGVLRLDFLAPEGSRFVIDPQGGAVSVSFQIAYTTGLGGAVGGLEATAPGVVTWLGLEGDAPIFGDFSTFDDVPHAYLSVTLGVVGVTQAFSFTGLRYERAFTGTGQDLHVPYFEGGNLEVQDGDYGGPPPPNHAALLSIAPVPEPAHATASVAVAALALACTRRRRR